MYVGAVLGHLSGDGGYIPVSNYYQYYHPLAGPREGDRVYEGGEPEAIRGAKRTIARDRPKLAISIYHAPGEQLVDLALEIIRMNLDYRFYAGHHDLTTSETVLYASPR